MPLSGSGLSGEPAARIDEGRHHRESTASVRLKAQRLRRALDTDRLDDAVKIAADVAAELRSTAAAELSPKAYYDVYLSVCAELRLLEMYVMESARRGAPVRELYERVQETPLVLPRLYLLVTAGSVYVKSMQAPAKDVLRDLVEMCAGVQHPQRGLFLRAYLAQMMKDKLPHAGVDPDDMDPADEDASGGTVQDSIDFVIRNFTEMNRLWVRMQHDCSPREMELKEKERLELRLLVGSNIATLSRLVGSNLELYRDSVLHAILDQIVSCNDAIAQEYLADCVAQVFPDEFQLATLEAFMQMCGKLKKGVNMRTILVSIIDRLRKFAASSRAAAETARKAHAFHVFRSQLPDVVKRQGSSLQLTDRLGIYLSLMSFVLEADPERMDYVDDVLGFCVTDMDKFLGGEHPETDGISTRTAMRLSSGEGKDSDFSALSTEDEKLAVKVLTMPLEAFRSVGSVLLLENYVVLQRFLSYDNQRSLAAQLLVSTTGYTPCIEDVTTLEKLFKYVAPLVQDRRVDDKGEGGKGDDSYERFDVTSLTHHHEYLLALIPQSHMSLAPARSTNAPKNGSVSGEDAIVIEQRAMEDAASFQKHQELVARIVYLCDDSDVERALVLYTALRQELLRGGSRRVPITMPSLILASLRLALRCGTGDVKEVVDEILSFAGECVSLFPESSALLALRLQLHVAATAASLGKHASRFVYDNLSAAFVLFEQHITTARDQHTALELIIVSLGQTGRVLEAEAFEALSSRAVKHASRSLTRSDQCVLLCQCAQLFPSERGSEAGSCLERAGEAAGACMNAAERVLLLLDVSRTSVAVHETGAWDVTKEGRLAEIVRKVRGILSGRAAKSSPLGKLAAARYQRLVNHLRASSKAFPGLDFAEL